MARNRKRAKNVPTFVCNTGRSSVTSSANIYGIWKFADSAHSQIIPSNVTLGAFTHASLSHRFIAGQCKQWIWNFPINYSEDQIGDQFVSELM